MTDFELLLFTVDTALAQRAISAGVDALIVDWENRGKPERQRAADTQINHDTREDLNRLRAATESTIIVRINGWGRQTPGEIQAAAASGADEILLPMVESEEEVLRTLDLVGGRMKVGILIETVRAVKLADRLGRLPLRRVFVGLNDLAIQRGTASIFEPLADGTLEAVRRQVRAPFGFGGLTLPTAGCPIPCRLLMGEMARLHASFSFLRRSFLRDTAGRDLGACVAEIRAALRAVLGRAPEQTNREHAELIRVVQAASASPAGVA